MEEVLSKMNQLESIILNAKNELEQRIEELRQDNQMQHEEIQEKTTRQIEELRKENQRQIEELRKDNQKQIEELCQENEAQHKQMYLQICGKMILENTKLERKIKKELQNQFAMGKMKNVEKVRRLNDLDSRVEKNESDIMLCQSEVSKLKESMA